MPGGVSTRRSRRLGPERTVVEVTRGLRVKGVAMAMMDSEMVEPRAAQTESDQRYKASDEARQVDIQANARFLTTLF